MTSRPLSLKHLVTHAVAFVNLLILSMLLCIQGCTKAQAESHAESQSVSLQPDMTLENYTAGCSTAGCHMQLTKSKWVHAPVATGACSVCHLPIGKFDAHQFEPTTSDNSSCRACHTFDDSPKSIHEPFALGTCQDCHNPHGGDRKSFMPTKTTQALCVTCHDEIPNKFKHHPVNQGDCQTCHEAHQSSHEKLLVQPQAKLCLGCHQDMDHGDILGTYSSTPQPAQIHEPMLKEGCMACHTPHGSTDRALLVRDQRSVCMDCHEAVINDLPLAQSIHGAFEGEQACMQCHSPHASDHAGLLSEPSNQLCFTCHDKTIESASGGMIPDMKKLVDESPTVHAPAALGQCTSCHESHYSAQHSLLRASYPDKDYSVFEAENYEMCFECHDSILIESEFTIHTGFRDGTQNLHYMHINREKGRACGICHQPHAGLLPKLMREQFPFGPGGWNLPIGFVKSDTGGSCLSACHEKRSYDNYRSQ